MEWRHEIRIVFLTSPKLNYSNLLLRVLSTKSGLYTLHGLPGIGFKSIGETSGE